MTPRFSPPSPPTRKTVHKNGGMIIKGIHVKMPPHTNIQGNGKIKKGVKTKESHVYVPVRESQACRYPAHCDHVLRLYEYQSPLSSFLQGRTSSNHIRTRSH